MKTIRLCFYLFVLSYFNSLFAQEEVGNGMIFPQFEKGSVVFKNGTTTTASLNYDMIRSEMLFMNPDSTVMAISNLSEVAVVIIDKRRFFPASSEGVFYEEIQAGKGSFFIQRIATMLSQGKAAGYGSYSQTGSISSYNSFRTNEGLYMKLNPDEKFIQKTHAVFYLKSGDSYKKFYSAKTLGKLFKGLESEIGEFANKQSIDFTKADDVARIVEYGYSLK